MARLQQALSILSQTWQSSDCAATHLLSASKDDGEASAPASQPQNAAADPHCSSAQRRGILFLGWLPLRQLAAQADELDQHATG